MRPAATKQNPVHFPLNELLGTEAQVRLLRVLSTQVAGPISASEAAERAGLTDAGARRALRRLTRTGIVTRVGGGRAQQFALRETEPLVDTLTELFCAEVGRFDALLGRLRHALQELPGVRTAWVDALPSDFDQPLQIAVVGDADSLAWTADEIRRRVAPVEQDFELTIEVHTFTRADEVERVWNDVMLLAGAPPGRHPSDGTAPPAHVDRDERALRMSRAIARLVEQDSSLVLRAIRHVDRKLEEDAGGASHDLREWHSILSEYSRERLMRFLISSTPRAQRLRQSSPFFAVLNPDERREVLDAVERGW